MAEQENTQQEAPVFRMQKMYVKDLSFESPGAPQVFLAKNQEPRVDFDLKISNTKVDDEHYEVSLSVTARIVDKSADENVMFVVEIDHAARSIVRYFSFLLLVRL